MKPVLLALNMMINHDSRWLVMAEDWPRKANDGQQCLLMVDM